jgi:hypothetical protein
MSGGQTPGSIELLAEPFSSMVGAAYSMADEAFRARGSSVDTEMPRFYLDIARARLTARLGTHRRADMPVIDEPDLEPLREALAARGFSDICDECLVTPSGITPTQCQIYVDKSIGSTARFGSEATLDFIRSNHFVVDRDFRLIDGHHRWLSAYMLAREQSFPAYRIRYGIEELMSMLLDFSDSRNERNG